MSFKSHDINLYLRQSFFNSLINYLIHCSDLMLSEYLSVNKKLNNNENEITYHFIEEYLDNNNIKRSQSIKAKFDTEIQVNYNDETNKYKGRADIRIATENIFNDRNDYYIIECKRIDRTNDLNKKYIGEGVFRFISEKYSSYNDKNIMFGFIIKDIDIKDNTKKIEEIQNESEQVKDYIQSNFNIERENDNIYVLYSSNYRTYTDKNLELSHLFYNFSFIIEYKDN